MKKEKLINQEIHAKSVNDNKGLKGWREIALGSIAEITMGQSPPGETYNETGNGLPFYQGVADFGYRYPKKRVYCTSPSRFASPGDILFSVRAPIGRINIATEKCAIGRGIACIRSKDTSDQKFLEFVLRSKTDEWLVLESQGSIFGNAKKDDLIQLPIPWPNSSIRRAIASVLSSLDDKIDLLHRQNKTLEAMAETLFRQWFIEPCKNGLPKGWREGKLPDEFDFTMGASPPGESYNEEGLGIPMFQGNADFGFRFPTPRVYTTKPIRFAKKYDTLISVRAPVGEQNMAQEECCIGRGVAAFRCKYNSKTYTYYKLKSLMSEIKSFNDTGTVFGSISKTDFESVEITIPPVSLILQFEQMVSPIDNKIINNCNQIRTLEKLRDLLLPKLTSGEIRVKYE